jgi:hypothetical protein
LNNFGCGNDISTGLLEGDLEGIVCPELDAIKRAMTESASDIHATDAFLTRLEAERGSNLNQLEYLPSSKPGRPSTAATIYALPRSGS